MGGVMGSIYYITKAIKDEKQHSPHQINSTSIRSTLSKKKRRREKQISMQSLLNSNPNFVSIQFNKTSSFRRKNDFITTRISAKVDEFGLLQSDNLFQRNPAISTSYRNSKIPKPNQIVLDAQSRVCTGPTQTKPLNEEQARKVLNTILKSVSGELKEEDEVSKAQLGAFFAAMTIRASSFPESTQWSEGEKRAMSSMWPLLVQVLPPDVIFIANPTGTIMGGSNSIGAQYYGNGNSERRMVSALREVLRGGHLECEDVKGVLRDVLPLEEGKSGVRDSLLSAFLIGQRMNRETDSELEGYCLAFDDELVRACYGESCLLHGVDWMPPKGGITEEQMLNFVGANTHLNPLQAKILLEDEDVGFTYLSQREARPSLFSLVTLRDHIKKRPPLATTEKVQQLVRASGREAILAGFYHEGYEDPLLMLMRRRGVHSGLVIKGEEGALSMTTRERPLLASKGLPVNYCSGFRASNHPSAFELNGVSHECFSLEVNAKDYGFESSDTPRTDRSVTTNIKLGLAALHGEKGPAYDRIVLNAGLVDHLLGCDGAEDIQTALDRARAAIDSGKALSKIMNYIKISHKVKEKIS
ncbi:hypothetical protein AQUCO_06100086v1 [Aquilegia coerulea]|uniref:Glycosyl transferase family 3 domain-containing protein n=1 Tax=Aquilegia coerulea TaxID=218851 RepID=A0A2G5CDH8_AQUCA|nr:hypothetical protein AQUCO_06100086v1 [Aquilegia coerulea]